MKILTTTGFYGTGSSAVTDLLSEYDNVSCKGDFEIRLAHDPYGISDLEYNIIQNTNRNNSSNALKKFIAMVERLHSPIFSRTYENYFNNRFKEIADKYIDSLCEFKYYGRWHYDLIERGKLVFFLSRLYNKMFQVIKNFLGIKNEVDHCILSEKEPAYGTIMDETDFLKKTTLFFDELINEINKENNEFVMLDQLVPPSNIARYERYFSNIKVIVVDRDPRDIFLLEKNYYKGHTVPYYNIDLFCKWFEWTRRQYEVSDKGNSIKICFEDLIYKYDETVKVIEEYIGLDKNFHSKPFSKFIPEISKKNTRLWEKYNDCMVEINIIEERLKRYCYSY